ncbi:DHHW family protein [Aneurinibacillus uraniidurans]|uniref:DHHW family protein n=1 Tax=Aneurinibacillus uraniidurans TaxID=2966586 RepID=UPI0023499402|nr:DHHW family protein [Aneurinibacillus sp. B1]WCN36848.1 DHHW family protein [Aneurinibacillus sp. B1]
MSTKIFSICFVATFLLIIFGIGISSIIKPDVERSYTEARKLQQLPTFSEQSFQSGDYFRDMAAYTSDQLAWRDNFVKMYDRQQLLTPLHATVVNNTVVVDHSWLLEKPTDRFHKELMDNALAGIRYLHKVVKPNDTQIYYASLPYPVLNLQELYPSYLRFRAPAENKKYFLSELNKDDIHVIDLAPRFAQIPAKERETMYFHTDHHWNIKGAFTAYQMIIEDLNKAGVLHQSPPLTDNDIIKTQVPPGKFVGSWNRQLNMLIDDKVDRPWIYKPKAGFPFNQVRVVAMNGKTYTKLDDVYGAGASTPPYQYSTVYTNDHDLMEFENKQANNKLRVLIFKDSYANAMLPFVASHFYQTQVLDLRYKGDQFNLENYLKSYKPDVVLFLFHDSNLTTPAYPFFKE